MSAHVWCIQLYQPASKGPEKLSVRAGTVGRDTGQAEGLCPEQGHP